MAIIVQKYGGSSLSTVDKIKNIAKRVVERYNKGDRLAIVVSALGETTDRLISNAKEITDSPDKREMDMLLSVGERVSISMMALAINDITPNLAISFTGSQIGLITDCNHRDARILEIKGDRVKKAIGEGKIPVVAGFQGVSTNKEITTLGRGGSDTTAVALAASLNADICEIYSNVSSVYTDDPFINGDAKPIKEISYDMMLEISTAGAKVLKDDAVEFAKRLGVKIVSGLSKDGSLGTIVTDLSMDKRRVVSLVYNEKIKYLYSETFPEGKFSRDLRFFQKCGEGYHLFLNCEDDSNSYSLCLIGSGIKNHPTLVNDVVSLTSKFNILAMDVSNLRFEIFYSKSVSREVIDLIHNKYIGE
ncbi:MAG: hypothetical protein CR982_05055 [Candidatus Cloacimonadota bacterium]|nr:MAG: hypothetical protein CR982_05055 [Candidatus Cloacimonadota bacterium]PIE80536.1 MAG: hypothetical protein CSA15_01885 [Candidatus Delongbacteria bacterium]